VKDWRRYINTLTLHLAGVVILFGVVIFLAVRALVAVHQAGALQSAEYQQAQIQFAQLQARMAHLQGLPQKVDQSRKDAGKFFDKRIAQNYSTVVEQLGNTAIRNQVRLTRAQYTPAPATDALTEVRIDANLSGDYIPLMHFINDLERDKDHVFFLISGVTFPGQQGGTVNLRLRLITYISANATDLPPAAAEESVSEEGER
jgi:type IV pilus assembly protein PilO